MLRADDLRPRTVGEILDAAATVFRLRFGRLLLVATILSAPTLVFALFVAGPSAESTLDTMGVLREVVDDAFHRRVPSDEETAARADRLNDASWSLRVQGFTAGIFQAFSRGLVGVAMAHVAWAALRRREVPGLGALLRVALPRAAPAAFVHLVLLVVVTLLELTVVGIPAAVIVAALLAPACAVVAFEEGPLERDARSLRLPGPVPAVLGTCAAGLDAIARSFVLGWHPASVARSTFLVSVVLLFLGFLATLVGAALWLVTDSFPVFWIAQHYVEVLLLPFIGLSFALWYVDLRVRREALDLAPPPSPAASTSAASA